MWFCGFAVLYASTVMLIDSPHGEEIRNAYMEVFEKQSAENDTNKALLRIFRSRIGVYFEAAKGMEPDTLNPIALKFGSFIDDSPNAKAWLLAHKYAPIHFSAHIESTLWALRNARLIN